MDLVVQQPADNFYINSPVQTNEYYLAPSPYQFTNHDLNNIIENYPDVTLHIEDKDINVQQDSHIIQDENAIQIIEEKISDSVWGQRLTRIDFLLIYAAIVIISILSITVSVVGSTTTWYRELKQGSINPWLIRVGWVIATLLSYVGLYLLWEDVRPNEVSRDLGITVLFMIGTFLSLGWASVFYYAKNVGLSLWLLGILFVYKFWLFMYIWYIKPVAAVFLIPILLMYIYLMYSVAHLAYLNNIKL